MFGNCCGRKKSSKKETRDAETQSEYELFEEKPGKVILAVEKVNLGDNTAIDKIEKEEAIVDQPHIAISLDIKPANTQPTCDESQDTQKSRIPQAKSPQDFCKTLQKQAKVEGSIEMPELETIRSPSGADKGDQVNESRLSTTSHVSQTDVQIKVNGYSFEEDLTETIDDEVFEEGVGPPIKLAKNMGKPLAKGQVHVPLPKWFSEEDEAGLEEKDGTQEPPATPIGKDELALRRHRFFSELLTAAQNATEHKVHFDPLGPSVAADLPHTQELEQLVSRLENVTSRLENVCQPVQEILKLSSCASLQDFLDTPLETPLPPPALDLIHESLSSTPVEIGLVEPIKSPLQLEVQSKEIAMSVYGYQDVIQGPLSQYFAVSQQLGGDVATHAAMVKIAFDTQLQYITLASESKQPSQADINNLIQPTAKCIQEIQEFREKNRGSQYFNHLSAISESIPALGWVAVSPTPSPYVKEMNDAGQFYTNRVLKDWKEKDKKHVDWVKSWVQTLTDLQAFVKQHHTTGLVWSGKNLAPTGVPPPPGPPPPPAMCDLSGLSVDPSQDRSALFEQINQGADITKGLKKVTSDMQTHKNPTLRTGPAPFKLGTNSAPACSVKTAAPVDKLPVFSREGKKWMIEYQKGNHNLLVDGAEMNNVVYLFKCTDSTVTVKGKINSITLDSCKKTSVVFDSLVSVVEFINCQSVQMQVLSKVPTISIDKTDGCQMYLSNDSLNVEIVSSKSSEMNVLVPKPNGEYAEYPIPEQYKTTVVPGGLCTIIVESKG